MRGKRLRVANKIARRVYKIYGYEAVNRREIGRLLGKYRKTKVFCSDPMCCGNPRRIGRLPIRELKQYDDFTDQVIDT